MPNHITNNITGPRHVLEALVRPLNDDEKLNEVERHARTLTNFAEKIKEFKEKEGNYPSPENYYWNLPHLIRKMNEVPDLTRIVVDFELLVPQPENVEKGDCSGYHEPGVECWYSWNVNYWGTKWNAYSPVLVVDEENDTANLQFETAWSHPYPIIKALAKEFPDESFHVEYADEDFGYNVGEYIVRGYDSETDTVLGDENFPEGGSDEANEMAARIRYGKTYAEVREEWDEDEDEEDDDE